MENKVIDLQEFNMSDEELFSQVDNNKLESEKITAPRYSYWKSVFRVFLEIKSILFFWRCCFWLLCLRISILCVSNTIGLQT